MDRWIFCPCFYQHHPQPVYVWAALHRFRGRATGKGTHPLSHFPAIMCTYEASKACARSCMSPSSPTVKTKSLSKDSQVAHERHNIQDWLLDLVPQSVPTQKLPSPCEFTSTTARLDGIFDLRAFEYRFALPCFKRRLV